MSYATGTVASATPATDLMTTYKTAIDAHAGWEFVESVTSGAIQADVFRCLASVSGLANDWYLVIRRTSATSALGFYVGEAYDTGTHILSKMAPSTYGAALTPQSDGTLTGGMKVDDLTLSGQISTTGVPTFSLAVNTSGFVYWFSVKNKCAVFCHSTENAFVYIGSTETLRDTSVFPGFGLIIGKSTTAGAMATRDAVINLSYFGWVEQLLGHPLYYNNGSMFYGTPNKDPVENKWFAQPINISVRRNGASVVYPRGYIHMDHLKLMGIGEFSENLGDTVTIDGVVHTCVTSGVDSSINSIWLPQT